jgi:hypothetical protein
MQKREAHSMPYFGTGTTVITPSFGLAPTSTTGAYLSPATIGSLNTPSKTTSRSETSLGDDTLLGVPATGSRTTLVFPVGSVGNDQPITVIREYWESKDLRIMLLTKVDDPRSGESTVRVTQLDRTEPDATLFQVPADFTIVEK